MQLVGEMEQELEELCQLDICRLEECIGEYKELEARNKKVASEISSLDRAVKRLKELDEIASISEDEARQLFERADSLINKDELLGSQAFRLEVSLDKLADLDVGTVDVPVGILDGVEEIIQAHAKNLDRFENLDDLIGRWNGISKVELVDVGRLDGLREEEQILLSQLVECPHCGTELTEESRAVLIGESR
jgi:type I site-specific restriction endonuclease